MIIGLTGLAQSGKDTTADHLVEKFGFTQVSFAAPLKQISYDIDPLITPEHHLAELVDQLGWDHVKTHYPEARRFLQRIGTEGLRKNVDDNFWVNLALQKIIEQSLNDDYVISDMRFTNEYDQLEKFTQENNIPFATFRLMRDGLAVMNHASEKQVNMIPVTYTLDNNFTIKHLHNQIDEIMTTIR